MRKWLRGAGVLVAGLMVLSACGVLGGDDDGDAVGSEEETTDGQETADVSIADARITIASQEDTVNVNGTELASGAFQDGMAGDVVEIVDSGTAIITAESVFEIEALRGAKVTIPDLAVAPLDVTFEFGHLFVRLNPDANVTLVVDTGERQFTTRSPDAEFAMCQAPDGASCLTVLSGEVEWNEEGVATELYAAGEASFAARGAAPDPARCADETQIADMQRSLRGEDFAGALADIVATWEPCGDEGGNLAPVEVSLPSAARMEQVVVADAQIGSPEVDADSENVIAQRPVEGAFDYYIEPLAVTNGEFRSWLAAAAGDDADLWRQYAPQDWLDRAPGGAATQAIYAQGTADESVKGIAYATAVAFCANQAKRLPTEIEWELAAVRGVIEDLADSSHDWVSDFEAYGPGPDDSEGRQVLRGVDGIDGVDEYYRIFALEAADATAARRNARIRCAADEVAVGGQTFENVILRDDFNSLSWPQIDEDPLELDYHPENYHLDLTVPHSYGAVVRPLEAGITDGRIDIDLFIERENTGAGTGNFRFGGVFGAGADLHTLTIQPDNFAGDRFTACVMPMSPDLVEALDVDADPLASDPGGRFAGIDPGGEGHYGEDCVDAETSTIVPVTDIDSPVRLTLVLVNGGFEAWVNDVLVDTSAVVASIDTYGFYSQIYHRDRSHIHFDDLIVATA